MCNATDEKTQWYLSEAALLRRLIVLIYHSLGTPRILASRRTRGRAALPLGRHRGSAQIVAFVQFSIAITLGLQGHARGVVELSEAGDCVVGAHWLNPLSWPSSSFVPEEESCNVITVAAQAADAYCGGGAQDDE